MAAFLDLCRFIPTLGGTTDFVYSSAVAGCQSPALAGVQNGVLYKLYAVSTDLSQWEVYQGAYNSSTGTFPRTAVLYNSAGTGAATGQSGAGTKINFTTVPQVSVVALAEDLPSLSPAVGNVFTGTMTFQNNGNGVNRTLMVENNSSGTSAFSLIDIGNDVIPNVLEFGALSSTNTNFGGPGSAFFAASGALYFGTFANAPLQFVANSLEKMRLSPSGAFGVGTTVDYGAGSVAATGCLASAAPVTKTANYTQAVSDGSIIFNGAGSLTLTLLSAASYPGRWLNVKTVAAQTVVSASSNVVPLVGGAASTAILAGAAGKWARLQSDGTNWVVMEGN